MGWLLAVVESLAYAFARGAVRAWLDVVSKPSTAVEEVPNAEDVDRAARLRASFERGMFSAKANRAAGSVGAPPPGKGS